MKIYNRLILSLLAFVFLSSFITNKLDKPAATASLEIKITAKKKFAGNIKVALCNNEETFTNKEYLVGIIKNTGQGELAYTFKNIPIGVYAVRVFQDVDGDGELTSSMFGIPKEPFGFSLNPVIKFGPPSFKDASFAINSNASISINLVKF